MKKQKNTFSEELGKLIEGCGQTRYRIHKATGLSQSMLSRLVSGKGWIGREAIDILTAYLDLELSKRKGR